MSAIRLVSVAPGPIAAVRRRTTFAEIPRVLLPGLDVVWKHIREKALSPGHNVAVYRPLGGDDVDLTCAVQVAARFEGTGEVVCSETPGGEAAMATHVGAYDRLGATHDAVLAWARANGRRPAGVSWEVYGDWIDDPAKLETEVYALLEPIRAS